jgi:hypothetical protein
MNGVLTDLFYFCQMRNHPNVWYPTYYWWNRGMR